MATRCSGSAPRAGGHASTTQQHEVLLIEDRFRWNEELKDQLQRRSGTGAAEGWNGMQVSTDDRALQRCNGTECRLRGSAAAGKHKASITRAAANDAAADRAAEGFTPITATGQGA
jgi:hypothetical protein